MKGVVNCCFDMGMPISEVIKTQQIGNVMNIKSSAFLVTVAVMTACTLSASATAQTSQTLEAMKAEANSACATARAYQKAGKTAISASRDPSRSKEARMNAKKDAQVFKPMFDRAKALCLQKKAEYNAQKATAAATSPAQPTNGGLLLGVETPEVKSPLSNFYSK